MTSQSTGAPPRHVAVLSFAGLAIVGTLCVLYIVSQFFRNSVGVIAPDLASEMNLSALELGLLSSVFFFSFAATQLPLGVALDRLGPKRCMLVCLAFVIVGTGVFAYAASAAGLITGRILLGIGSASFLMAPLALYARWFRPDRFSTLTGVHLGIGSLGTLFATAPLAWAADVFGWRFSFLGVGVITVLIGLLVLTAVSDDPPGMTSPPRHESLRESLSGILESMRTPSVGRLFLAQLASYSSLILILGLWGGPYLTHVYGYDIKARGDLLFVPAATQIIGSVFWGPMDRVFGGYKPPVLVGAGLTVTMLLILAAFGMLAPVALFAVFAMLGFSSAVTAVLIAHGKSLFPPHLLGRGMTLLNMATVGGVFVTQTVSGVVIDLFPAANGAYPLEAYQLVFALQAAFLLFASLVYFGARDPARHPQPRVL
jgi:MFS family permease